MLIAATFAGRNSPQRDTLQIISELPNAGGASSMAAAAAQPAIDPADVSSFLDQVDEVTRLVDGLKAGTISVDYVDTKLKDRDGSSKQQKSRQPEQAAAAAEPQQQRTDEEQQRLLAKVEELKANRERQQRIRQQYEAYTKANPPNSAAGTDYNKWDLWCPDDEEDDLWNNLTPPQFQAMEKDINERHQRMVERRQLAERQRVAGNAAFKAGQWSEALRCYQAGLESQRHDMALQANAALAALKLKCWAQAEEHSSKVLHLAEVLFNRPADPLCIKALQRRAAAYQGLGHVELTVKDLQRALKLKPGDQEITKQLSEAQAALADQEKQQQLQQLLAEAEGKEEATAPAPAAAAASPQAELQLTAQLCKQLAAEAKGAAAATAAALDAAKQLNGLIQRNPDCEACFRLQGGLPAAVSLAAQGTPTDLQLLQLLHTAAAASSSSLAAVAGHSALLQQLCQLVAPDQSSREDSGSSKQKGGSGAVSAAAGAAAADLLQLVAATGDSRQQLAGVFCGNSLQLVGHWLEALPQQVPALQAAMVAVLANCGLCQTLRAALAAAVHAARKLPAAGSGSSSSGVPGALLQLLQHAICNSAPSSNSSSQATAAAREAVRGSCLGLAGNLCSHPQLREWLAQSPGLVTAVLQASTAAAAASTALSCLCNLLTCPAAQAAAAGAVGGGGGEVVRLLRLALALPLAPGSTPSSSSSSNGSTHGPQLPRRSAKQAGTKTTSSSSSKVGGPSKAAPSSSLQADPQAVAHAALAVSRLAGAAPARGSLVAAGAGQLVLEALQVYLEQQQQQQPLQSKGGSDAGGKTSSSSPGGGVDGTGAVPSRGGVLQQAGQQGWLDSVVRLLASLLADPTCLPCCTSSQQQQLQLRSVCQTLVRVLKLLVASPTSAGNAALCLGNLSGVAGWGRLVHQEGGVQLLVEVMMAHKGGPACRNAAISLAKLGKAEGEVLLQLRELHAFEMMVQYVKP